MRFGRLITTLAAAAAAVLSLAASAVAQDSGWQDYPYPDAGFAVHFPAPPVVSSGTYTSKGKTFPAAIYAVRQDKAVFTVTIADLSGLDIEGDAAIDEAVKAFGRQGEIRLDVDARINHQYGHELSVAGKDGSRSMVGVFFFNHHLYQLEGRALPPDAAAGGAGAIRFQQSLQFPFD